MIEVLLEQAVDASLSGDWGKAVDLYNQILSQREDLLAANLGLAFALMQTNELDKSIELYERILADLPSNNIAQTNLARARILKKQIGLGQTPTSLQTQNVEFVHIPGKTKVVSLVVLGQLNTLLLLAVGQEVELVLKKRRVEVRTLGGEYIGTLPDDLSRRIFQFIENGNIYQALVKSASKNLVEIFIKEILQSEANHSQLSFVRSNLDSLKAKKEDSEKDATQKDDDTASADESEEAEEVEEEVEEEPELLDQLAEKITEDDSDFSPFESSDDPSDE